MQYFIYGPSHFLVFANSIDNNGETLVNVDIFKFEDSSKMFTSSPWQSLSNLGAVGVDVFDIEGVIYMAVANNYDSKRKSYVIE